MAIFNSICSRAKVRGNVTLYALKGRTVGRRYLSTGPEVFGSLKQADESPGGGEPLSRVAARFCC